MHSRDRPGTGRRSRSRARRTLRRGGHGRPDVAWPRRSRTSTRERNSSPKFGSTAHNQHAASTPSASNHAASTTGRHTEEVQRWPNAQPHPETSPIRRRRQIRPRRSAGQTKAHAQRVGPRQHRAPPPVPRARPPETAANGQAHDRPPNKAPTAAPHRRCGDPINPTRLASEARGPQAAHIRSSTNLTQWPRPSAMPADGRSSPR